MTQERAAERKFIPAGEAFRQWDREPAFRDAYDALEDEFALAGALIKARGDAGMTQEQVARAMGTTRPAVVRLENGQAATTRTLECFARTTGMRLRISLEPRESASPPVTEG